MIPFGLEALMTVSLPIGRRATKCLVPGASAIYLFNEGSGTTLVDYSGNARDGTLGAAAAAPTWGPTGLTFDGGDHATLGNAIGETDSPFSITVVYKNPTAAAEYIVACMATTNAATGGTGFYLVASTTTGNVLLRIYNSDAPQTRMGLTAITGPTLSAYQAVTVVYTGSSVVAYNRTVAAAPLATGYAPCTTSDLTLAKYSYADSNHLVGEINAVLAYPFALTAGQVAQNHAALQGILAPRGVPLL